MFLPPGPNATFRTHTCIGIVTPLSLLTAMRDKIDWTKCAKQVSSVALRKLSVHYMGFTLIEMAEISYNLKVNVLLCNVQYLKPVYHKITFF